MSTETDPVPEHLDCAYSTERELSVDVVKVRVTRNESITREFYVSSLSETRGCNAQLISSHLDVDAAGWAVALTIGVEIDYLDCRGQPRRVQKVTFFKQRAPFPEGVDCRKLSPLVKVSHLSCDIATLCTGRRAALETTVHFRLSLMGIQRDTVRVLTNPNPAAYQPGSAPYGHTYAHWAAKWWKHMLAIPAHDNPVTDQTGDKCATRQSGPVWFLAPNFGGPVERTCTVPAGKALLFPIIHAAWDNVTAPPPPPVPSDPAACAAFFVDHVTEKYVVVDGERLGCLDLYRAQSPSFAFSLPPDNILGVEVDPGRTRQGYSVSDGFWVMLKPLPVGKHTIRFGGKASVPDIELAFENDVTYRLTIVPA